jgi:serine/threonine protein kinase
VASGAEGVVYRGFVDLASGAVEVAVKMLQPGHLANLGEWTNRWRDQVELLKQVEIPGLVAVRGGFVGSLPHPKGHVDVSTASLYLVMDWVEGVSLDRWARSVEVAEPDQLLLALVPVAAALDLLHSGAATAGHPVVHRDVKPANILIRPGGDTVLVDVGSVRGLIDEPGRSGVVGTPGYIAPEVRADARYSPAADRYSLGAVAFALLTGTEPPPEGGTEELGRRLLAAPLLQGRADLVDHVLAMLDPLPERRPTGLANWVAQLRRSSLVALPGEVALAPRAPGRNLGQGGLSEEPSSNVSSPFYPEPAQNLAGKKRTLLGVTICSLLLLAGFGIGDMADRGDDRVPRARPAAFVPPTPASTTSLREQSTTPVQPTIPEDAQPALQLVQGEEGQSSSDQRNTTPLSPPVTFGDPLSTTTLPPVPVSSTTLDTPLPNTCSAPSDEATIVDFINERDTAIDYYWVDFECNERYWGTITAYETYAQGTYVGHIWRVRDPSSGITLKEDTAISNFKTIVVSE